MSIQTKTIVAFSLSLAVTLALAGGAFFASCEIQQTHERLRYSEAQLQNLASVSVRINNQLLHAMKYLLLDQKEAVDLSNAALDGACDSLSTLIDICDSERHSTGHLDDEEVEEAEEDEAAEYMKLIELRTELVETKEMVSEAVEQHRLRKHEKATKLFREVYQQHYVENIFPRIEELVEEEKEQVERRKARMQESVRSVRFFAGIASLVGLLIACLAVLFLKNSLDAINRAKDVEVAANQSKSTFLANMSHEIRTPLNGILGFTRLLMQQTGDTKEPENLNCIMTINSCGKHLLYLINDILDLSKIEAGQFECHPKPCRVMPILEEVVSMLRVKANVKSVPLEFRWTGGFPALIRTDAARLKQILINIIGNAVKFTDCGSVLVIAHVEERETKWMMVVEVTDTGIGIDESKLGTIFNPFEQADATITREHDGTGLGLTISKQLAELLGGDLTVSSTLGEGSTFTLTIDIGELHGVKMLEKPVVPLMMQVHPELENIQQKLSGLSVLIVEDGKTNRDLVRIVLQQAGVDVLEAENGLEGMLKAMANPVDAILMDLQMPVMDGLTATRKLRDQGFNNPIVALTAHAMDGDRAKCFDAGCSGYLSKPVEPDDVLRELAAQLNLTDTLQAKSTDSARDANKGELKCTLPIENPAFFAIAQEFIGDFLTRLDTMCRERDSADWTALASSVHWLKGAGGTAGFAEFTEPAAQLEKAVADNNIEMINSHIETLKNIVQRIPERFLEAEGAN